MSDIELIREVNRLRVIIDNLVEPEVGQWITWTPTVTQGVAVTITITYARYIVLALAVIVQARLAVTSAGTGGSVIQIGGQPAIMQPANFGGGQDVIGNAIVLNSGTANYAGSLVASGVTDWRIVAHLETSLVGITPNFALASGDVIGFQAAYEH